MVSLFDPLALRCLKAALNADCDGQIGLLDLDPVRKGVLKAGCLFR